MKAYFATKTIYRNAVYAPFVEYDFKAADLEAIKKLGAFVLAGTVDKKEAYKPAKKQTTKIQEEKQVKEKGD